MRARCNVVHGGEQAPALLAWKATRVTRAETARGSPRWRPGPG
jgi:hypothetical protein